MGRIVPQNDAETQHPPDDAQRFLELLDPRGQHTFQTFKDSAGSTTSPTILHGTLEQHLPQLRRLNAAGAGCFVTVAQTDLHGRKASNVTRIRAFFVDLDGSPLEPVLSGPLPPHIVIETSHGKWHCYWLIDHCDMEHFGFIQKKLAQRFGGDEKVIDLPRVMRLPGFYHQKGTPFLSVIIQAESGRYALSDFLKAFKITLPERKQAPEPTRKASHAECTGLMGEHLAAIATAVPGTRNDTLNARAFFIGQLVAAGAASEEEALQAVLAAATGIEGAAYTAKRSIGEGIQKGPYRISAPPPHFPIPNPLPPVEARAELGSIILNRINDAENWKFLKREIEAAIAAGETARNARRHILKQYGFTDLIHAMRDMIRATPGLGKTRQTVANVLDSALELVLFYTPTTALAEELAAAYPGQVKAIKGRCESNCSHHIACQFAGERGLSVYGTFCEMEMDGMPPIRCSDFNKCPYLAQFENTGERIIVLSHEYLKLDFSLLRRMGVPDLHVIDESIINLVAGTINFQPAMLPVDFRDLQPGDDALARAIERGWTLEDTKGYRAECYQRMQEEAMAGARGLHPGMDVELALARMKAATTTGAAQRWRFFSTLASQWELGKGAEAIRIGTKPVTVDGKIEQQTRVFVSFKRELAGLREGEPVLLLDADGDIDINRALVSARMQEHIVEAARNVRVIQVSTSSSKTAMGLPEGAASAKLTRMATAIRGIPGEKLVVTYKDAEPLADFGNAAVTHFGGFLGQNQYAGCDTTIILGRNLTPCTAVEDLARAIYLDSPEPLVLPGRYVQAQQGYTMNDGSHRGTKVQAHPDSRVNAILDIQRGKQTAQAVDRLRLVNDDKSKLAIILDNTPTPLLVDELVTETGFMTQLAIGKSLSQGGGFAVLNQANLESSGLTTKEAEKVVKSLISVGNLNGPELPPPILDYIYGGDLLDHYPLAFQKVVSQGGSVVVASLLGPEKTAEKVQTMFGQGMILEALARTPSGVLPLNKRWLVQQYPDLFTSMTDAFRAIAAVTPTGTFRVEGGTRATAFIAATDYTDPRASLELLTGKPLAEYDGPIPVQQVQPPDSPSDPPLDAANDVEKWAHWLDNSSIQLPAAMCRVCASHTAIWQAVPT